MDKYYLIKRDSRYYYFNNDGEVADPISITYTWTVAEKPTIQTELKDKDFGCSAL